MDNAKKKKPNHYQKRITAILGSRVNPRHVEAYMRCECGTLDGLSSAAFAREAREAEACVNLDPDLAERLAKSYGL